MEYTLRRSPRARRVRLNVTPDHGLVVVVPRNFSLRRLPGILDEKSAWIESALLWAEGERALKLRTPPENLPDVIFLQSIAETWDVDYRVGLSAAAARECGGDVLGVCGPDEIAARREALRRWLSRKARAALEPLVCEIAAMTGMTHNGIRIGNQKTVWASCSTTGTISLNRKMLFLPPRLVHYLLVHELCHTVHMNHSPRFWNLVERHEPDCRSLDRELRDAGRFVPSWAS